MREFIMRARRARTNPDIDLDHLSKEGKIDTICAAVSNALWISNDIRRDAIIHVVMEGPNYGPKTISFFGHDLRGVHYDELSIALIIKEALRRGKDLTLNEEAHVRAGVKVSKKSFERLVWERCMKEATEFNRPTPQTIVLDKYGKDIRKLDLKKDVLFIFGSAEGLPPKTEEFMKQMKAEKVSLGPMMLFAAHCPIIVHNEMDRKYVVKKEKPNAKA